MPEPAAEREPTVPLRERRRIETKAAVVDAAEHLFSTQGYAKTRMRDIAHGAGISEATLYRHFPSKPDIAFAGMQDLAEIAIARLAAQPPQPDELDAALAVLAELADAVPFAADAPALRNVTLVFETPELWDEFELWVSRAVGETAQALARRAGRDEPELRDEVFARAITGAIQAAGTAWLRTQSTRDFLPLVGDALRLLAPPR
jgi:AcrR family transcriptional regulator